MPGKTSSKLHLEIVRRANASGSKIFSPIAIGSDGERLIVNSRFKVYRGEGDNGVLSEVRSAGSLNSWTSGLIMTSGAIWAFGSDGITRSTDGGDSFAPVSLPWEGAVRAMALDDDGTLWAGDLDGAVLVKAPKARTFSTIKGTAPAVTTMAKSRLGMLIGDEEGRLWIGAKGALKATSLKAGEPVRAILETDQGTIVVLAGGERAGVSVSRSTNGGTSFETKPNKLSLLILAQVPGGPIVAGGWDGLIAMSSDEGRTFEKVAHATGLKNHKFETSCVHRGSLLMAGDFQNLVSITAGSKSEKKAPAKTTKKSAARSTNGYVSSGRFRTDLESNLGKLKARAKPRKREAWLDEALAPLPATVADEVSALFDLYTAFNVPRLCGLREGGFCSIPAQHDLDEAGVRDEKWFKADKDIKLVMNAIEIYNDQGSPFVLVAEEGVCFFYEDPHGYSIVANDLESFLRTLVTFEAASRGKIEAREAQRVLASNIKPKGRKASFFERVLEQT